MFFLMPSTSWNLLPPKAVFASGNRKVRLARGQVNKVGLLISNRPRFSRKTFTIMAEWTHTWEGVKQTTCVSSCFPNLHAESAGLCLVFPQSILWLDYHQTPHVRLRIFQTVQRHTYKTELHFHQQYQAFHVFLLLFSRVQETLFSPDDTKQLTSEAATDELNG